MMDNLLGTSADASSIDKDEKNRATRDRELNKIMQYPTLGFLPSFRKKSNRAQIPARVNLKSSCITLNECNLPDTKASEVINPFAALKHGLWDNNNMRSGETSTGTACDSRSNVNRESPHSLRKEEPNRHGIVTFCREFANSRKIVFGENTGYLSHTGTDVTLAVEDDAVYGSGGGGDLEKVVNYALQDDSYSSHKNVACPIAKARRIVSLFKECFSESTDYSLYFFKSENETEIETNIDAVADGISKLKLRVCDPKRNFGIDDFTKLRKKSNVNIFRSNSVILKRSCTRGSARTTSRLLKEKLFGKKLEELFTKEVIKKQTSSNEVPGDKHRKTPSSTEEEPASSKTKVAHVEKSIGIDASKEEPIIKSPPDSKQKRSEPGKLHKKELQNEHPKMASLEPFKPTKNEMYPPEFLDMFQKYAMSKNNTKTRILITRSGSDRWIKKSGILNGKKFTPDRAHELFTVIAGKKIALGIQDYAVFLKKLAVECQIKVQDVMQCMCGNAASQNDKISSMPLVVCKGQKLRK